MGIIVAPGALRFEIFQSIKEVKVAFAMGAPYFGAPTKSMVLERLLVIADAAAQIANPSHEAYLRNRFCVGTRLWKHVAHLSDLTFRLLHSGVLFQPKRLAGGVLI